MFSLFPVFLLAQLILAAPPRKDPLDVPTNVVSSAWYAGSHSSDFTLQDISWAKYTSVIYAFAFPTPDSGVIGLEDSDKELLPQFVQTARDHNVLAILSIGGWTRSQYFSSAVATDKNRTAFAQAVMKVASTYQLDGVEFHWEFPTTPGMGCNLKSNDDSTHFLRFLETLRNQDGAKDLIISAAVPGLPFNDADGNAMKDVSGFAKVLDYIELMNYDVWGPWSEKVGPNAPLDDSCATDRRGSAMTAVKAWSDAGFPTNKIILGVASYGYAYHVDQSSALDASGNITLYAPFDQSRVPPGDKWDSTAEGVNECGDPNTIGGVFDFWGLIDAGFLTKDGTPASGIDYTFDECSQTAFVYNPQSQVMVSYDDADSFAAKGDYINEAGLAGFAMWEAGGDSNDILLDAIANVIG